MRETPRRRPGLVFALLAATACSRVPSEESASQPLVVDEPAPSHPFLVVRESDYAALRAKRSTPPWSALANSALAYAATQTFDPLAPPFEAKTRMTDLCGALALAYVLEPGPAHVTKLRDTLLQWPAIYLPSADDAILVRWQQSAMTQSIVALDVMHDALAPADLTALEDTLGPMVMQWWRNLAEDGTSSTPGVVGTWALYAGRRHLAAEAAGLFLERLLGNVAPSGVYAQGPGFAWARKGGDRLSKHALLDLLESTGRWPGLYADPQLVALHEWMFRGSYTPRRTNLTFGDSDPTRPIEALLGYLAPYRAHALSAQAGGNAAWVVRDVAPAPLLANYVLLDESLLTPVPPSSAIWGDAATFWEAGADVDSLMGGLWNPRTRGGHSHRDVNAVHLYAYGENVLRNSGYCGTGIGIDPTFDWTWVHETAASSNTLTIANLEHDEKVGDGILEGFTAPRFDYAAGGSGPALDNGEQTRSLLLVHGEPGLPGYFVLLDEVEADTPGDDVQVNLHPDSALATTVTPLLEYRWSVQQVSPTAVEVTLFLGTRPASSQLLDGGFCAFDGNEYVGRYLRNTYLTDALGERNVVTLVVPHDLDHPKPGLIRLVAGGLYSGALVSYPSGVADFVLESKGTAPLSIGAVLFQGKAVHGRTFAGTVTQYFVRAGRVFDDGAAQRTGFDADTEVSVFVRDTAAYVTSAGATVVFHDPALTGNVYATEAGTVLSAGPGFVEIELLPGRHAFDLATGASL